MGPLGRRPFLRDAAGEVTVAVGDARLTLEREAPQGYDVLVVDAFSSDAIPTHLLTREAFLAYRRHLAPGGVLAVHAMISVTRPEQLETHQAWQQFMTEYALLKERVQILVEKILLDRPSGAAPSLCDTFERRTGRTLAAVLGI